MKIFGRLLNNKSLKKHKVGRAGREHKSRLAVPLPAIVAAFAVLLVFFPPALIVYRECDLMMGVLTLEGGGVIRVTESELDELRAAGVMDRDRLKWVDF